MTNEKTIEPVKSGDLLYTEIRKIVWGFADVCRDHGSGTVEDYAKIVLPTCLLKRILDLQLEFNQKEGAEYFAPVLEGLADAEGALEGLNGVEGSYSFFDFKHMKKEGLNPAMLLISWLDIMNFQDNPNSEERSVGVNGKLLFGQTYITTAKTSTDLMFEIIGGFSSQIRHVFNTFEYRQLILEKNVLPFEYFYQTCHNELSKYAFTMANISSDIFSNIYMDLTGRFASDAGKKGGEFFTPTHLVINGWRFLDIEDYAKRLVSGELKNLSIADPTAGSNTLLICGYDMIKARCEELSPGFVKKSQFAFYGQELKAFQYCLGVMNMAFHNTLREYNYGIDIADQNSNVITNYFNGIGKMRKKMDIVVANPPYGTKNYGIEYAEGHRTTDQRWEFGVPKKSEGEYAFLMTIYDLLNDNGRALVFMPLGTLFRDSGKDIRRQLVELHDLMGIDVVEGIVVLPSNMFLTTTIPVAIWILRKDKKEKDIGKVFMVNASEDFEKIGKFNEWQPEKSIKNYLNRIPEDNYSGWIDVEKMRKSNYNLSVSRYFLTDSAPNDHIELSQLIAETNKTEKDLNKDKSFLNELFLQLSSLEG